MKLLRYTLFFSLIILFSCGESISPRKLKGKSYTITSYYIVDGLDYATWLNIGDINKLDQPVVRGTWSFTKDDESTLSLTYLTPNFFDPTMMEEVTYMQEGILDMTIVKIFLGWIGKEPVTNNTLLLKVTAVP